VLDLIDQLRVAIPEEVRAAKRINSEGERILEKAQEEATRITSRAQEQAAFLIGERGLTELAEAESKRIVAEAQSAADEVRDGADDYAHGILSALEGEVSRALSAIQRGIDVLAERRDDLRPGAPGAGPVDEDWYEGDDEADPAGRA
jgi:cell division septum initiation protein DivIVA